jgi:RNA polymerase sigma-70 factor (ECF subfamily)
VGCVHEYGREQIRAGSLHHTLFDEEGDPRAERVVFRGEALVVLVYASEKGRVLRDVLRFEADGAGVRRFRYYYFCPELLEEVAQELGRPLLTNGYRYR